MNRGGTYVEFRDSLKNKKATIILKNIYGGKHFKYSITIAFHHKESKNNPEIINSRLLHFGWRCCWKEIKFSSDRKDW